MIFWILTTNLLGLCAVLAYLVWHWRDRALVAEEWRQMVSDKGTDYIAIKATGEPVFIGRPKPIESNGGGYRTGRQRMQDKMKRREHDAVVAPEVAAGILIDEDLEYLNGG